MTARVRTHPLISMHPSATVQEAAQLMNDCSIACVGVLDADKHFSGIVTERDITAFVASGASASESMLADIVNDFPVVVDGPIANGEAIERMRSAHIRHLIVREADDFRVVSMRDFMSAGGASV